MARELELDGADLATIGVGTTWGVAQGSTWAAATEAQPRRGYGALLLGMGLGAIAGTVFAENVEVNLYRSLVLGAGAAWGGWLGLGGTYVGGVPWKGSVVGGLTVSNLGILAGLALASETESLVQVGWVNLSGLAGLGLGTALGVTLTKDPRGRVASMVGGSLAGLVGGILAMAHQAGGASGEGGAVSAPPAEAAGVRFRTPAGLARMLKTTEDEVIVLPGMTWLPPSSEAPEAAPLLQVTVLH